MNLVRIMFVFGIFALPVQDLMAETFETGTFQTSLLELYTSEGCSSCPPAEAWLSQIEHNGFKPHSVVPLAYHVTYWDYLGWKDKFSAKEFDRRQRRLVRQQGGSTVYTPQFFLNGKTLRYPSSAVDKVNLYNKSLASVTIKADIDETENELMLDVYIVLISEKINDSVKVNVVVYENNIRSVIKAGENAGRESLHQYVVRELKTAFMSLSKANKRRFSVKKTGSKKWSGLVIFVESGNEVIQVLDIALKKRT